MPIITPETGGAFVVADANDVTRVEMGQFTDDDGIPTGDYGLKVVSSDGATVIIDGTTSHFHIVASGTLSKTVGAGVIDATVVNLPGLGTFVEVPVMIGIVSQGLGATGDKFVGAEILMQSVFVALSSGGAVTHETSTIETLTVISAKLEVDDTVSVTLEINNTAGPGSITRHGKYYVMAEAAL